MTGFIALLMLNFGLGEYFSGNQSTDAITIDDTKLSMNDYFQKKEQLLNVYRNQYGKNFPQISKFLNIEQQTTDALINEVLLERYIHELGLSVGLNQLKEYVAQNLFPQGFSPEGYRNFLRQIGMNGAKFEATLQRQLVSTQLMNLVRDLNVISEAEAKARYGNEHGKFKFRYISVRRQDFEKEVKQDNEDALKEFFEKEVERYRIPRKIRYSYIPFKTEDHLASVEVTDEDLQEAFREQQQDFREPKTILLKQLVLKREPKDKPSELENLVLGEDEKSKDDSAKQKDPTLEKAKEIIAKVKEGTDFDLLIQETVAMHAPDAKQGLGTWSEVKQLTPEIRRAVQDLNAHDISKPIETNSTISIVRVEDVKEAKTKSFEEVRNIVEAGFRRSQAPTYARAAAETFLRTVKKDPGEQALHRLASDKKLPIASTGMLLSTKEDPSGVAKGLTQKVAEFDQGANEIVAVGEVVYLVSVEEVKDSELPTLEKVKDAVRKDYVLEDSKRLAREFAENLRNTASQELAKHPTANEASVLEVLKNLAASKNLTVSETALVTREETTESLLQNQKVREGAFSLRSGTPLAPEVYDVGPTLYILALAEHVTPTDEEFNSNRAKVLEAEKQRGSERVMKTLIAALKARSNITINPTLDKAAS